MPAPILAVPSVLAATKGLGSMGLAKAGIPLAGGLLQIPAVKKGMQDAMQPGIDTIKDMYGKGQDARGYMTGYDTKQTPFDVAKERGLAGVAGGFVDNITGGMTDLDKRGDSKKQKDTKDFLRKFIFGTQGVAGRDMEGQLGVAPGSMNYEMPN